MASEERPRGRPSRKLTRKRKEPRKPSLDIPERFKDGDDVMDDVTAPKSKNALSMNQSLFSMIARAGQQSQADLGTMQEIDSGDSDDEGKRRALFHGLDGTARLSRLSTSNDFVQPSTGPGEGSSGPSKHRRALSDNKLLRSLPKLKTSGRKENKTEAPSPDEMSSSQFLPPRTSKDATREPLQAEEPLRHKAKITPGEEIHVDNHRLSGRKSRQGSSASNGKGKSAVTLAKRLQEIFEFETAEEVISEYPCWLLQSILLQGFMYITQKHICFYAYFAKKHHDVTKTGYLSKRGRSKYNRYWFILRGNVMAYFSNPAELYFPRNRINLEYAISAEVLESKDKSKDETTFIVTTDERTYQFKADSAMSAKEWVRSIQKVIFRTHNEGNSVKICLPIRNVLEIEESTILDFADTFKIRVIDNDETFAIDEYFFSFFSHGQDALNVLRIMINDNDHHQQQQLQQLSLEEHRRTPLAQDSPFETPKIEEKVRATLSPLPGPLGRSSTGPDSGRSSADFHRKSHDPPRGSIEASRILRRPSYSENRRSYSARSMNRHGERSPLSMKAQDSSDSPTTSFDPGTEESTAVQSLDDNNPSASQILSRSDVFRAPAMSSTAAITSDDSHSASRDSQDTTRSSGNGKAPQKKSRLSLGMHRGGSGGVETRVGKSQVKQEHTESEQTHSSSPTSTSALQSLASYPLQKASGLAGFLRTRSKRMGGLLATESMGYYEKVSGMLAGGRKNYNTADGLETSDHIHGPQEEEDAAKAADHFREHFAFPESEQLQSSFFASLQRVLPNYGKIYISNRHFCFRSLMPTSKTKVILPIRDIENVNKEKGFQFGYHGLAVVIRGHEELFFEFSKAEYRDECTVLLLRLVEENRYLDDDSDSSSGVDSEDETAKAENDALHDARQSEAATDMSQMLRADHDRIPLIFDDPLASIVDFKPSEPLTIVCLTIGSRGDVQPYIALCKELLKEGHKPRIATHAEFEPWIRKHGIDFAPVEGNPAELMRICVEHGMFTFNFMKEANSKFRGWLDAVCSTAWKACQGADVLIESPSAMAGLHIAEALEIPYFRAFTMPWTRTRAYPHAFSVLDNKLGGAYNSLTYITFNTIFWTAISGQINKWRRTELKLPPTNQRKMQTDTRPFLYNFSPHVVPPPLDWPDWIRVTGYWFLDEGDNYVPPVELVEFIEKARSDNKKLVYIGFGSIVIEDPPALMASIVESVNKADVRCILTKGWSDRLQSDDAATVEVEVGPNIFQIESVPHDWLFKQMDAAVHHGGSGTTGASLRAGIPTVIKPFFGDQYFFAQRMEDLGVGSWLRRINVSLFSRVLWEATNSQRMIIRAKVLGEKIRKENGAQVAVQTIYRELDRARALVKKHPTRQDVEEDWTLIEDEEEEALSQPFGQADFHGQPIEGLDRGSLAFTGMVMKGAAAADEDEDEGESASTKTRRTG